MAATVGVTPGQRAEQEDMLTQTLGRLFALTENYPNLKANENFTSLQNELARHRGPDRVRAAVLQRLSPGVQQREPEIPTNIIAGVGNVKSEDLFQAVGDERGPVQVRF